MNMNIVWVILTFCLLSSAVFAHNDGHGEMCQHLSYLSDLYERQCVRIPSSSSRKVIIGAQGKRGGIGPIGPSGPPGPPGIVNYEEIDQKIASETDASLREMNVNYHKLEQQLHSTKASLQTTKEKLDNLTEKFSQMEQKLTDMIVPNCEVKYDGKCFRAIVHDTEDVYFAAAETMCDNGWKLANIYSKQHYDIVASYLRTKLAPTSYTTVWLGMTYDANQMYLSDGTLFTKELPWFPNYPKKFRSFDQMNIYVQDLTSRYQGVLNLSAKHQRRGVLCEI